MSINLALSVCGMFASLRGGNGLSQTLSFPLISFDFLWGGASVCLMALALAISMPGHIQPEGSIEASPPLPTLHDQMNWSKASLAADLPAQSRRRFWPYFPWGWKLMAPDDSLAASQATEHSNLSRRRDIAYWTPIDRQKRINKKLLWPLKEMM